MAGWRRTYWAVWTANLITAIGMMTFLPFFPSYLEELGLRDRDEIALWSGVIYGAAPLAAAFTSPLWGALGDRFGRKLMVLRAMGAIALFVGLMALAETPWQLLALRLAQGVFSGFVAPSLTLVSVAAPPERQGRVSGSLQTALAAGAVLGPAIGGVVSSTVGLRHVFIGVSALGVVASLLVAFLAHEDPSQRRRTSGETTLVKVLTGAWGDLVEVFAHRGLRGALIVVFCIQFALGTTNPLLELFARDLVGPGRAALVATSVLFSVMALVNLPAMPLWGRYGDRVGHRRALVRCALASALAFVAHALAPTYGVLVASRVLLGGSMAGASPTAFGLAAAEVSIDRRGGAFGAVFSARTFAIAVSAVLGGWLSRYIGIRGLFVLGAVVVLLAAFALRRPRAAS